MASCGPARSALLQAGDSIIAPQPSPNLEMNSSITLPNNQTVLQRVSRFLNAGLKT